MTFAISKPSFDSEDWAATVERELGIRVPPARRDAVEADLRQAATRLGEPSFERFLERAWAAEPRTREALITALTVGETYFHRDPAHFRLLSEAMLPELLARTSEPTIRIWSAGCATGEEAYSLAMTAVDAGAKNLAVLATDLNPRSLRKARAATYGAWSFRGMTDEARAARFTREGALWKVRKPFAEHVSFAIHNLCIPPGIGSIWPRDVDVVFCRNVLIYFGFERACEVIRELARSLSPDGWLVLGPSDPAPPGDAGLVRSVGEDGAIVYRKGNRSSGSASTALPLSTHVAEPPRDAPSAPRLRAAVVVAELASSSAPVPQPAASGERSLSPQKELAADPLALARSFADAGDTERALLEVTRLIEREPMSIAARLLHCAVLEARGETKLALEAARTALIIESENAGAHVFAATSSLSLGRRSAALRHLHAAERILDAMPEDSIVPDLPACTCGQLRRHVASLQALVARKRPIGDVG